MGIALSKLAQEDPSFRVETDEETGQTLSPVWVSFTLISSLTACVANSG